MKRLINFGLFCFLMIAINARASPILTGDVSFDDITNLYTYTYTIDTTPNGHVTELSILQNLGLSYSGPSPVSHTEPDGWNFVISLGGISEPGESHIFGSYWAWQNFGAIDNSNELLTFSFTTERGVNTTQENNYLMFDPYGTTGPPAFPGIIVGKVVGPEFVTINEVPVPPVPENETYAMMMVGLGIVGFIARRKEKRSSTKKI